MIFILYLFSFLGTALLIQVSFLPNLIYIILTQIKYGKTICLEKELSVDDYLRKKLLNTAPLLFPGIIRLSISYLFLKVDLCLSFCFMCKSQPPIVYS